jgi:hypothetical protein
VRAIQEYTGSDGHRYRWRLEPGVVGVAGDIRVPILEPEILHESFDGLDQDRNEIWVESAIVDEAAAEEARGRLG